MSTAYPMLRSVLRPEFAESSDAFIESVVLRHYAGAMDAAEAEEFLNGIGNALGQFGRGVADVARQAAPHVMNALPGVLSGAASGAALGPWGALAGAAIGGVTSAVGAAQAGQAGRAAPAAPARPMPVPQMPAPQRAAGGGFAGGGGLGALAGLAGPVLGRLAQGGGAGALGGQIAGLLGRPEVQQALMAQLMGALGRPQVAVGGAQVPTSAVMNMMGSLFQRAGQPAGVAAGTEDESIPAYLLDGQGQLRIDAADPDARADALLEWFEASPSASFAGPSAAAAEWSWQDVDADEDWGDDVEAYDAVDEDFEAIALTTSRHDLEAIDG